MSHVQHRTPAVPSAKRSPHGGSRAGTPRTGTGTPRTGTDSPRRSVSEPKNAVTSSSVEREERRTSHPAAHPPAPKRGGRCPSTSGNSSAPVGNASSVARRGNGTSTATPRAASPSVLEVELHPGERSPDDDPRQFSWRNRSIIGTFLDPYIEDTNLEGGFLAETLGEIGNALHEMVTVKGLAPPEAESVIHEIGDLFLAAKKDGDLAREKFSTGQGEAWIRDVLCVKLAALEPEPPRNLLVQEGGWRSDNGGHAIVYVFEKTDRNVFAFTIVNTGAGVHAYHPSSASATKDGKMRYRTALRIPRISSKKLLSLGFLFSLFRMKHVKNERHRCAQLYNVLLPWLLEADAGGDCATAAMQETSRCGDLATVQRSGTCFFKCVAHAFRFVLQLRGCSSGQRKAAMLALRRHLLGKIAQDLPDAIRLRKLTDSERLVATCAARQTARKALREHTAKRLDDESLKLIRETVDTVLSSVSTVADAGKAYTGDTFAMHASWTPFGRFLPLIDAFNMGEPARAALAGPPQIMEPPPFVDVAQTQELFLNTTANDLHGYVMALQSVVDCADELERQKNVHAKRQVLALVEDLLIGGGSAILLGGNPRDVTMNSTKCRELICLLDAISRHYVAAALSVTTGRATFARRVVTYAVLLEQQDRVARCTCDRSSDGPAPFFGRLGGDDQTLWDCGTLWVSTSLADTRGRIPHSFDAFTAFLPITNADLALARRRAGAYFSKTSKLSMCGSETGRNSLFLKNVDDFPGVNMIAFCSDLLNAAIEVGLIGAGQEPAMLEKISINRPIREFEIKSCWAFDKLLDAACPEWKHCRDTFVRFHVLLGAIYPRDDGGDAPPWQDSVVPASEAHLRYIPSFTSLGSTDYVQFDILVGTIGKKPGLLYTDAPRSLCDPHSFGINVASFGIRRYIAEEDVLASDPLPDFGHSMSQRDAEEFFCILAVPAVRIPLLLRFFVPDRVGLLHDTRMQNLLFHALFEPGLLPKSGNLQEAPCSPELLCCAQGFLMHEFQFAPAATLGPMIELLHAMPELSSCNFDGPYVSPFLFVLRLSILLQGFLLSLPRSQLDTLDSFTNSFRRFNQAYARSRIARWLDQATLRADFAAAAMFHAHIALTSMYLESLSATDVQSLVSSATLFRMWYRVEDAAHSSLTGDLVDWVSASMHKQRLKVLAELTDGSLRNQTLNFTLEQALGHKSSGSDAPQLRWNPKDRDHDFIARVVVETSHNFTEADMREKPLLLPPKVKTVTIRFDPRSIVQSWQTLQIKSKGKVVWETSNSEKDPLPGTGDAVPLVLSCPGGALSVTYQEMGRTIAVSNWGYKLTAEMIIPESLVNEVVSNRSAEGAPAWACAEALAACGGNATQSYQYLQKNRDEWQAEDQRRRRRAALCGLFEGSSTASSGQWLEGAVFDAQSGLLFFQRRGGFEPLPDELLAMPDFRDLHDLLRFKELGQPNCVLQAQNIYRPHKLQFSALGSTFTAEIWQEIPVRGEASHVQRGSDGIWVSSSGEDDPKAANLPYKKGANLRWLGADWQQIGNWRNVLPERLPKSNALRALLSTPPRIEGEQQTPPESWLEAWGFPLRLSDTACFVSRSRPQQALLQPQDFSYVELRVLPGGHVVFYLLEEVARAVHRRAIWASDTRGGLFCCDPDTTSRLRAYPSALAQAGGDMFLAGSSYTSASLRVMRQGDVHVPRRLLEGLLPRALLRDQPPAYDFWQTAQGIRGEPRDVQSPWFSYTLNIDLPNTGPDEAAVWRAGYNDETWFLVNVEASAAKELCGLCNALRELEPLAYVLIWASQVERSRGPRPANGEQLAIRLIELPRLGLRFDPEQADGGGCRFYSRAHAGFFLSPQSLQPATLPHALPPENAVLRSRTGEAKLIAPISPLRRVHVYVEPFNKDVSLFRELAATERWHTLFVTYEISVLRTALQSSSQLSALWLCATRLLQRDYVGAAQLLIMCTPDHRFTKTERQVWQEAVRPNGDSSPDACAVRLRLFLLADHWGSLQGDVGNSALFSAWGEYLTKLTHVSGECRLTWREELVLRKVLKGCQYENEILNQLVQNRMALIEAFPKAVRSQSTNVVLACGWQNCGFWWTSVLEGARLGKNLTRESWQVETVRLQVEAKSELRQSLSLERFTSLSQATKFLDGMWCTVFAVLRGGWYHGTAVQHTAFQELIGLALREFLCHTAPDATGTSLEAAVALSLLVLWRDSLPGGVGVDAYPTYEQILATHTEDVMGVDTATRASFFLELATAALRSLNACPWDPYAGTGTERTTLQETCSVDASVLPFELPRGPADFSCPWRKVGSLKPEEAELVIGDVPLRLALPNLSDIAVEGVWSPPTWQTETRPPPLPSLGKTLGINRSTLDRMSEDIKAFQVQAAGNVSRPELVFLRRANLREVPPHSHIKDAMSQLSGLLENLAKAQDAIFLRLDESAKQVHNTLNICLSTTDALAQGANLRSQIPWHWALLATLDEEAEVITALGRSDADDTATATTGAIDAVMRVLVFGTMLQQLCRCLAHGFRLQRALRKLLGAAGPEELREAESAMESLAVELLTKRACGSKSSADWGVDPKLLAFEWLFGRGLLRHEQLSMVRAFAEAAEMRKSKVQQMIMGGGKTHVIGPLLQLYLSSRHHLVVQVVPESLLAQTTRVMRCELSQFLAVPVWCFDFSRRSEKDPDLMRRMRMRLQSGLDECAVVCSTGSSVKAVLLTYIDQLAVGFFLDEQHVSALLEMQRILKLLRCATAVLDEVDLLLHPLKSEMNFPLGQMEAIDLTPERWELSLHLLEPFCLPREAPGSGGTALGRVRRILAEGQQALSIAEFPHVLLLSLDYYHSHLLIPLRAWLLEWLVQHPDLHSVEHAKLDTLLAERSTPFSSTGLSKRGRQLIMLARDWLFSMLPHCLSKINRVQYGLLLDADVERLRKRGLPCHGTRLQLAVPFVGKDTPAAVSEFSHPEVLIGLTALACAHSGLRRDDVRRAVTQLKGMMINENVGQWHRRPSWRKYQRWLASAELRAGAVGTASTDANPRAAAAPPLHLTHPEGQMLNVIHRQLAHVQDCQSWYLSHVVFPSAMKAQRHKLSATASELGSADLFSVRLGFSGTPASTLPLRLVSQVDFAAEDGGRVMATLTADDVISIRRISKGWTVRSLLQMVANSRYHALIDTGALVTGMNNMEVARLLLQEGLSGLDGVVFLARDDTEMVLTRGAETAIPLAECALAPHKRFTFYDNSHTTGIDIDQAYLATAALTLGKDMTFRDAQQGAWRMRRLGGGQRLEILFIEELVGVMRTTLGSAAAVPERDHRQALRDISAFLIANELAGEVMQASQLAYQDVRSAFKTHAISSLIDELRVDPLPSPKDGEEGPPPSKPISEQAMKACCLLKEDQSFDIPDEVEDASSTLIKKLEALSDSLSDVAVFGSTGVAGAKEAISRAEATLTEVCVTSSTSRPGLLRSTSSSECVDSEIIRESEIEQEKEVVMERVAVATLGRDALREPVKWELASFMRQKNSWLNLELMLKKQFHLNEIAFDGQVSPAGIDVRFSPNAQPQVQRRSGDGIWRTPSLILHVLEPNKQFACALTLAEAAAMRHYLATSGSYYAVKLQLRLRGVMDTREVRPDPLVIAHVGGEASDSDRQAMMQQQALLRFCQGDVWLTDDEVQFLKACVGAKQSVWHKAWTMCEAWRRSGGVQRWDLTPVGRVIGDSVCSQRLEEEHDIQEAAVACLGAAGFSATPSELFDWLSSHSGSHEVGDVMAIARLVDAPGWLSLVRRQRDEQGRVDLRRLAEEVAARAVAGANGAGGKLMLVRDTTEHLAGGKDFIAASASIQRRQSAALVEQDPTPGVLGD